jgi:putative ABC transport system permease protein
MNFIESLKMAISSITSNKLRSFLTMLGIIIGISSVITIVSLGQGGQSSITGKLNSIGATTVNVRVDGQKAQNSDYITFNDIKAIRDKVDSVKYISPSVSKSGVAVSSIKSKRAQISGTSVDYSSIGDMEFVYGRYFNENDYLNAKAVVIIDENAAKELFGYSDCTGMSFNLGTKTSPKKVTVIGVTSSSSLFGGFSNENIPIQVYVPATFLQTLYSSDFAIDTITIASIDKDNNETAGNAAVSMLESRHNNRGKEIYKPSSLLSQLDQINSILGIFTAFIGAVAAISLLVGGIGVMNIMLVSVTERTREIGIRKAIGANTKSIMIQFLTESVILSLIGGILGMIIGITGATIIGNFAGIDATLSPMVILGAILFSSAVGIVFGVYPARQAAKLNPIDALRYE